MQVRITATRFASASVLPDFSPKALAHKRHHDFIISLPALVGYLETNPMVVSIGPKLRPGPLD
jgi:hypothetical protein